MTDMNDQHHLGFVMGKAKLAPQAGHSIPRLELCGAVLATEIGQLVAKQLDILQDDIDRSCLSSVDIRLQPLPSRKHQSKSGHHGFWIS
jgi:hypothetical protein